MCFFDLFANLSSLNVETS